MTNVANADTNWPNEIAADDVAGVMGKPSYGECEITIEKIDGKGSGGYWSLPVTFADGTTVHVGGCLHDHVANEIPHEILANDPHPGDYTVTTEGPYSDGGTMVTLGEKLAAWAAEEDGSTGGDREEVVITEAWKHASEDADLIARDAWEEALREEARLKLEGSSLSELIAVLAGQE